MKKHSNIIKADVGKVILDLKQIYDKLLRRGKIPNNASISRLSPNYLSSTVDLYQSTFNHESSEVLLRFSGDSCIINFCYQTSTLLLLDHKVIGTTLVLKKKYEGIAFIYAVIVDCNWRHTWATTYLKYHSFKHLLSCGYEEVAFQALNDNHDTLKHARKVGAKIIADNYNWRD